MQNKIIISLGSNMDKEWNIRLATELLQQYLPSVCFSPAIETEPEGYCLKSIPYLNCVAVAYTLLSATELIAAFKEIECEIGRRPEDKQSGLIPIDIDLLQWNDRVLKPDDMERKYVISCLRLLPAARQEDEGRK